MVYGSRLSSTCTGGQPSSIYQAYGMAASGRRCRNSSRGGRRYVWFTCMSQTAVYLAENHNLTYHWCMHGHLIEENFLRNMV